MQKRMILAASILMEYRMLSREDSGWLIGRISYIDQSKIKVRAARSDFSDRLFKGKPLHINSLSQYLFAFIDSTTRVIYKVSSIEEIENAFGRSPSDKYFEKYVFIAEPIGIIDDNGFVAGVVDAPMVGSNVYACAERDLRLMFDSSNGSRLGALLGYPAVSPRIDIGMLFSRHLAILGNTGSGKSTTARLVLANLIQELGQKNRVKERALFVAFDLHGDYESITSEETSQVKRVKQGEYHVSPGDLSIIDWTAILDPSKRIQKPLLERAIKYSSLNGSGKEKLYASFAYNAIRDTSTDSHAARKFQIGKYYQHIEAKLDDLMTGEKTYKTSHGQKTASNAHDLLALFNLDFGNIPDRLTEDLEGILKLFIGSDYMDNQLPKIESILEDFKKDSKEITMDDIVQALEFVFDEEEVQGNRHSRSYSEGLVTQIRNMRDRYSDNLFSARCGQSIVELLSVSKGLIVLDVSQVIDEDGLKLLSNYIARHLFLRNQTSGKYHGEPVCLIFDEAHRYVKDAETDTDSIFNRIAREGRKFGVSLAVISQIPSELSRVVLSQTGAFIIHRIQNANDLDYVRRNVPSISSAQVSRLPSLAPGSAIILGSSIRASLEIQVSDEYADVTPAISIWKE